DGQHLGIASVVLFAFKCQAVCAVHDRSNLGTPTEDVRGAFQCDPTWFPIRAVDRWLPTRTHVAMSSEKGRRRLVIEPLHRVRRFPLSNLPAEPNPSSPVGQPTTRLADPFLMTPAPGASRAAAGRPVVARRPAPDRPPRGWSHGPG